MRYPLGQPVTLTFDTFSDPAETTPADPTTATVDIIDPTGATTHATWPGGQIVRDSLGVFHYDYTSPAPGLVGVHWAATGAVTTSRDASFTVDAKYGAGVGLADEPLSGAAGLVAYRDYVRVTGDRTSTPADVVAALDDALELAQDYIDRTLPFGTYTETLNVYKNGNAYPKATPVVAVLSPNVAQVSVQGAGIYLGYWNPAPAISYGYWTGAIPPQVTVTYTGGYTNDGVGAPKLPTKLRNALCRIAFNILHPATLPNTPAGVTSVHVGDVGYSGSALRTLDPLDNAVKKDLNGYRREQVRAWQT